MSKSHITDSAPIQNARSIADAVLFEGYMLYPYRANDAKNAVRWQFGVLAPPAFADAEPPERAFLQSDLLFEDDVDGNPVTLSVQPRFLHVHRRTVQKMAATEFADADSLDVGDVTYLPWDEAVLHEPTLDFTIPGSGAITESVEIGVPGGSEIETLHGPDGNVTGRLVREWVAIRARLSLDVEPLPGPYGVRKLRLRLENETPWTPPGSAAPNRPDALRHALVAAHLLVAATGGTFVSLIDPPEWATGYVELCDQIGVFPVLAGPSGDHHLVLASPIILYDHPTVAPESAAQFCDATEMDEMLTLRTLTLTDEEKRQARGSDARAAALIDHVDNLPPELVDRLHGAIRSMSAVARPAALFDKTTAPLDETFDETPRDGAPPWWDPAADGSVDPDTDTVVVDGFAVGRGTAVRLRPGSRRADAQDMFLDGRLAHVEAVLSDIDGGRHLAVTLDELSDDGYNPHGRFLYFAPDDIEPILPMNTAATADTRRAKT